MKAMKKAVTILLAVCIVLTGGSCQFRSTEERFDSYLDQTFRAMASGDTLSTRYLLKDPEAFGVEKQKPSFGTVKPVENRQKGIQGELDRLEWFFDYEKLREDQKINYDIYRYYLQTELLSADTEYYDDPCVGSGAVNTYIPVLLAEYAFYKESDIEEYLNLLETFGDFFKEIGEYQKEKSKRGLFMSNDSLDVFLRNSDTFLENKEENLLLLSFKERLEEMGDISAEKKGEYIAKNNKIVEDVVYPAYDKLNSEMKRLRGTGKNKGGLAGFAKGKKYFSYLFKKNSGSELSIEQFKERLEAEIKSCETILRELTSKDKTLLDKMSTAKSGFTDPEEIMAVLQEKVLPDYPVIPEVNYKIKKVSKSVEQNMNPAFYIIPPIDDPQNNVIYINGGAQYQNMDLFSMLAHEGYPGHLYQTIYYNNTNPPPFRSALRFQGYMEGWATYVENESYQYGNYGDENLVKVLRTYDIYEMLLYTLWDIYINYENVTYDSFTEYQKQRGLEDEESIQAIFDLLVNNPGHYFPYVAGFLEIKDLRSYAENELGDEFDLKQFHKVILDVGSAPFRIVKEQLEKYLDSLAHSEAA